MRKRCDTCLCSSCMRVCCDHRGCAYKVTDCKNYSRFKQLSIMDPLPKPQYQSAPRRSWEHYGISRERYKQLIKYMRNDKYAPVARCAAHTANENYAEYFLLSVNKNLSYEGLEKLWTHGDIERMPCGRSDFYGWRRYFFACFDRKMRRMGK